MSHILFYFILFYSDRDIRTHSSHHRFKVKKAGAGAERKCPDFRMIDGPFNYTSVTAF
jgi:hypothetical protein